MASDPTPLEMSFDLVRMKSSYDLMELTSHGGAHKRLAALASAVQGV